VVEIFALYGEGFVGSAVVWIVLDDLGLALEADEVVARAYDGVDITAMFFRVTLKRDEAVVGS